MTLTLLQGLVTVVCLEIMRRAGYIEYHPWSWDLLKKVRAPHSRAPVLAVPPPPPPARSSHPAPPPPPPPRTRAPPPPPRPPPRPPSQVAPLSFVFISYVVVSLISLGRVNVPMFTALRRLTILFVIAEEWFLLNIVPSRRVFATVAVMFIGAGIAAWRDLSFDPVSYFYLFLTNLFTSLYTVYINVVRKDTGLNLFAMTYYMNVSSMPVLLLVAWWTGDLAAALKFRHYRSIVFQVNFQASIVLAFILNLSTFYCTSLNSARTQTVVGQLKNFFAFLLGLLLFDDYIYDPINFAGLWVGFAGSVWYAYVTAAEKKGSGGGAAAPGTPALPTIAEGEGDAPAEDVEAGHGEGGDARKRGAR